MKNLILFVAVLLLLVACSPAENDNRVGPSPRPLNQASSIEQARAASLPGASMDDESEKIEESGDEGSEDDGLGVERVGPSGSVNLSDLTPENETDLTETVAVVQPAPGVPNSQAIVDQKALQDLANRLDVPLEEVKLLSGEEVEWPDGSLGCPEEEMMYIQVFTPGYLLILEADGQKYEYHTDLGDQLVLCIDGHPAALP